MTTGEDDLPPMSSPYRNKFEPGEEVTIVGRPLLDRFRRTWRLHHSVDDAMMQWAAHNAEVAEIGFYHGGDVLYLLAGVAGTWHECLFEEARTRPSPPWPAPAARSTRR